MGTLMRVFLSAGGWQSPARAATAAAAALLGCATPKAVALLHLRR